MAQGNPVYHEQDGWHFADETWGHGGGPFASEDEAQKACKDYCDKHL